MNGNRALEVALTKIIMLEGDHRSGKRVGREVVRVIAHHAAEVGDHVGRENVLIGSRAHALEVIAVLQLPGGLLDLLVGELEAREFMAKREADAVAVGQIPFVAYRIAAGGGGIGEILRYNRIEVPIGPVAAGADAQGVLAPLVLRLRERPGSIKASAR